MKKKIIALITVGMLMISSCMCVSAAPAVIPETPVALAPSADNFTLLDLTSDMVTAGLYAENATTELVFTMFTLEKDTYISLMVYENTDSSADILCGKIDATNTTVDEAKMITTFNNVVDVYTNTTFSFKVDEGKNPAIVDPTGKRYAATALTADETIDYMSAVLINEQ